MTVSQPKLRVAFLIVTLAAAGGFTAAIAHGDDPPSTASFRTVDGPNLFQLTQGSGSSTSANIVTGGTVSFANSSTEMHDVHFAAPPQGGVSCQQTVGGSASSSLRFPNSPTSGTWSGTCTFTRAGTYSFMCDMHAGMTGTVVVSDVGAPPGTTTAPTTTATAPVTTTAPTGTTPTTTAPTQTTTSTTPGPSSGTAPSNDDQSAAEVVKTLSVKVGLAQRGSSVRGTIAGARISGRVRVALKARRGDLGLAGKPATLAGIGSYSALATKQGALTFLVKLNGPARAALAKRRRLAVTVLVTAPAATGTATLRTFKVVVRPS